MPGGIENDLIGAEWVSESFRLLQIAISDRDIYSLIDGDVISIIKMAHHAAGLGSELDTVPDGRFLFSDIERLKVAISNSIYNISSKNSMMSNEQFLAIDSLESILALLDGVNVKNC